MNRRGRSLVLHALILFLAWRAIAALGVLSSELADAEPALLASALTLSEDERIRRWLDVYEGQNRLRAGSQRELYELLVTRLGEDAVLNIVCERSEAAVPFPHLAPLLFPRELRLLPDIPPGWPASAADYDPRIHVLEYGSSVGRDLDDVFELLAEGPDYKLWRCRAGPRR